MILPRSSTEDASGILKLQWQHHRSVISNSVCLIVGLKKKKNPVAEKQISKCMCSISIENGCQSNSSGSKIMNFLQPFPFNSLNCEEEEKKGLKNWKTNFLIWVTPLQKY